MGKRNRILYVVSDINERQFLWNDLLLCKNTSFIAYVTFCDWRGSDDGDNNHSQQGDYLKHDRFSIRTRKAR